MWRKTTFNMADGILTPCNVTRGSGMTCHWIRQVAAPCNITRSSWIMTLNSLGGSTLQCGRWLWFAQTSAILRFYFWFRFRPYHPSRHVILHQCAKFYPNRTTLGRKKWRDVDLKDGGSPPSSILDFRGPIMGSLKSPCTTSYRSSLVNREHNKLQSFWENGVFVFWRQTDRQTNR